MPENRENSKAEELAEVKKLLDQKNKVNKPQQPVLINSASNIPNKEPLKKQDSDIVALDQLTSQILTPSKPNEAIKEDKNPENTADETSERKGFAFELFNWASEIVMCMVVIVLLFVFVVRVVGVDGPSMLPTLHDNDKLLLLSNVLYTPKAGDVVVVRKESYGTKPLVKRIIAMEGQTVDIDFETHEVWVDGVIVYEPYINEPTTYTGDMNFPTVVPAGCIFVMGDNRNRSKDSREVAIGMIDQRCILGKVLYVVYPFDRIGMVK